MKTIHQSLMLSPIDSRYYERVSLLSEYFSEFALVKTRLRVEVEYFVALWEKVCAAEPLSEEDKIFLRSQVSNFSIADFMQVQKIEEHINHDVKAVEVFLRDKVKTRLGSGPAELVHLGLTSQDINDVAIPFLLKSALEDVIKPEIRATLAVLESLAEKYKNVVMIARTHGQPASPTSLGKELNVYVYRLKGELKQLDSSEITGKFGGATGNLNAHVLAYPDVDWIDFANGFLKGVFGLERSEVTTQINNFENKSRIFDSLGRLCGILQDLSQDMWLYLMTGVLTLETKSHEVGSSAMPHKVNPINFENAEGNLQYAQALFSFLSRKLLVSRLQRDLTDYTLKRNIGVPMAHFMLSLKNIQVGLSKIKPHHEKITKDIADNFVVVAEGIQTLLRREGVPDSYELVKKIVRGKEIDQEKLQLLLKSLDLDEELCTNVQSVTPENYTGVSTW